MFITKLVAWLHFLLNLWFQCNIVFVSGEIIRCIEGERHALQEFKRGFVNGDDKLPDWGSEDEKKECCNWAGVQCSNTTGHVIGLEAPFELRGEISPALLELHHLTHLNLSENDFGGSSIPDFMGSVKTLQYLNLEYSNLSGIVLQQLGNLTNLVQLDLHGNSLRLENLNWLSHLSSLSYLDLSGNIISDTNWPRQMLMLHSLKELRLYRCELGDGTRSEGRLVNPSSMSLYSIDLSSNYLSLATLDWLFNIRSLVHVDLHGNQLDGLIPYSIQNLTFLKELDLSSNNIAKPLAEFIENIPCKALEALKLDDNELSGSVPDFNSFVSLRELYLNDNKLKDLPTSFARLVNLEYLDVSNNSLEGIVSKATFKKLHNLKTLDLSFNPLLHISFDWNPPFMLKILLLRYVTLGPKFPTWLQLQRNLSILDLSYTSIIDEAPVWLWNFSTTLSSLLLSNNEISGHIHDIYSVGHSIARVNSYSRDLTGTGIKFLELSQNKFSGSIISICSMKNLTVLDLSYNEFSGELPTCWSNVTNLFVLNVAGNSFSGKIPHSLGFLQKLQSLHLNDNSFSGELPSSLRNCQYITQIDVGGNNLTGNIPKWIGSKNRYLILRQNRFYGSIPPEICDLTHIHVLDLSRNNLSGEVPQCLNNITSLVDKTPELGGPVFSLSYLVHVPESLYKSFEDYAYILVQWKMKKTKYRKKNLGSLKLIDLSSNELTGYIPQELFYLKGLLSLNLSRNSLEGSIPLDISHMEMLESLDLSRNHLSGTIPASLALLYFLDTLDLSHNNLSGKIPRGTQLQSFNESAYAGNAHLCGLPLPLCPRDDPKPPKSNITGKDEARMKVFMSLFEIQDLCISMTVGFIFGFWGFMGSLILKSWRIAYFDFFGGV